MPRLPSRSLGLVLAAVTAALLAPSTAAAEDVTDTQGWVEYQYRQRLDDRLRWSWGLGYRELLDSDDRLAEWSRIHLRAQLTHAANAWLDFDVGIGGYYSFQEPVEDLRELRTWQSAAAVWPTFRLFGRQVDVRHRIRLEQRWLNPTGNAGTEFAMRLRYRIATEVPLNDTTVDDRTLYLPLGVEGFSDFGDDTPELFGTRMRITAGLGWVASNNWSFELRYTAQRSRDTILDRFSTTDHIIDLRIRTTIRIQDLGAPW